MTTEQLYLDDAYLREATARVLAADAQGVVLDRTLFYARSGGQPGDAGLLRWDGGEAAVAEAVKGEAGAVRHTLAEGAALPPVGAEVALELDWNRRHRHMRMHTTLHLLCSVLPGIYATGNQIGAEKSRLDFDLPEPPAKEWFTEKLAALVAADHPVGTGWITEAELDANPQMVRTLSVQPPRGAGRIRLVRIGPEAAPIDLQPCGGTHVCSTGEIGRVEVSRLESKGRQNRRIHIVLGD
ncbi:alanyl-tRNA editing protein [Falsiroseomonas selenitidurans]|uniref:Alanine--tRNA ligase n=1 Tax=Falsiroseomonas selenitidurans TaxID=2716335 RepID=A0ABX1E3N4_9PROT|nr:alanyl-tRNA editing protein [Falsiroseomonas selenitidurans]NKC31320.1 alanyl-tRNA editing protein [Falsiroseomonas selenitidurans]